MTAVVCEPLPTLLTSKRCVATEAGRFQARKPTPQLRASAEQCRTLRLQQDLNPWLLTPEVLSFEHSAFDTLVTPQTNKESAALQKLRKGVGAEDDDHEDQRLLRMLRCSGGDAATALEMVKTADQMRATYLPLEERHLLEDLRSGAIYLHGRDRCYRPCLVIRVERMGAIAEDRERVMRLVMFVLEFAEQFALVAGRVQNWVSILDLGNAQDLLPSNPFTAPFWAANMISTALAITSVLDTIYAGRSSWLKIANMPGGSFWANAVSAAIPAEKREIVSFVRDVGTDLAAHFDAGQLEERYGGTAVDLKPDQVYPFRFFESAPNAGGDANTRL